MSFHVPEQYRITQGMGAWNSDVSYGNNGAFLVPTGREFLKLRVIASDGAAWEHVSVSATKRTPTWAEMCFIKDLFWDPEDCVFQLHPPHSDYVNYHPYTLHLWRPIGVEFPRPPSELVGQRSER